MQRIHLIIQGPILSKGITGATYADFFATGNAKAVVSFQSLETIQQTVHNFGHLFDEIVVSTWDTENITEQDLTFSTKTKLVKSKDITPEIPKKNQANGKIGLLKQFYSMQQGMEALEDKNTNSIIIKIRTDQYVPLDRLLEEYNAMPAENRAKIVIPYYGLNSIGDFYFAATRKNMDFFCSSIMQVGKYDHINLSIQSVHSVMPVLLYYAIHGCNEKTENFVFLKSFYPYFERFGVNIASSKEAQEMAFFINKHFTSFSAEILYATRWRGEIVQHSPSFHFQVETAFPPQSEGLNLRNMFIYMSPHTYLKIKGYFCIKFWLGLLFSSVFRSSTLRRLKVK